MAIRYHNDETDFRLPAKGRAALWIRRCVEAGRGEGEEMRLGPVNFIFCSPERHLEINRRFLGHDYATDVITFDYTEGSKISGDIFIDPATVSDNASERCIAVQAEMRRVMIHGVLHLCGYGDKSAKERKTMRTKEDFYLAKYYETI